MARGRSLFARACRASGDAALPGRRLGPEARLARASLAVHVLLVPAQVLVDAQLANDGIPGPREQIVRGPWHTWHTERDGAVAVRMRRRRGKDRGSTAHDAVLRRVLSGDRAMNPSMPPAHGTRSSLQTVCHVASTRYSASSRMNNAGACDCLRPAGVSVRATDVALSPRPDRVEVRIHLSADRIGPDLRRRRVQGCGLGADRGLAGAHVTVPLVVVRAHQRGQAANVARLGACRTIRPRARTRDRRAQRNEQGKNPCRGRRMTSHTWTLDRDCRCVNERARRLG